jgi:hypothetical protein
MTFTLKRTLIAVIAGLALLVAAMPSTADAAASGWKIFVYSPSGRSLNSKQALATTGVLAQFDFLPTPDDALLAMNTPGGAAFSIAGKTITATFAIENTGTFTYYGEPDGCGTPANVRLYFNTANGPFAFTKYWWSNYANASAVLAAGSLTVTAIVDPAQWSDWNGQVGTVDAATTAAFNNAATHPDLVGLSFGGGCFFENGVGVTGGTATFKLTGWTVQ